MADFRVELASQPKKYYERADPKITEKLKDCFEGLEKNPLFAPGKIKRLKGSGFLFRYRVGGLRVVYEVIMGQRLVWVLAIFPRGDVYKKI